MSVAGFPQFRFVLTSSIVGAGTVVMTTIVSSVPDVSIVTAGIDPSSLLPTFAASATPTGLSTYRAFCAAATTPVAVKASAGKIHKVHCINAAASARYLKIYNLAQGSVVVGTTVPARTLQLPASSQSFFDLNDIGLSLSAAITIAITQNLADTDTTAPAAADVLTQIDYV